MRWRSSKYFTSPKGLVVLTGFDQIYELIEKVNRWNGVFELVFHPAATTYGLEQTSLLDERIREYELLMKPDIIKLLRDIKKSGLLLSFREIHS
jgi:hypothetical protein